MELYQLRTFLIVAEEKGITRAAKRLFTTPPSISAHIKMLEDEWNVTLFRRTARGMEITEKGELLRQKAEATLLAAQDLSNHATQLGEFLMGSLRVGLNSSAIFLRVPQIIEDLQEHQPGVELRLINRDSAKALEDLNDGSLDAGFIFGLPEDKTITTIWLDNTELAIAAPKEWEGQMAEGDWQAVSQLQWISSDNYCSFQAITDRLFQDRGLRYRQLLLTNDDRTKIDLIGSGLGVSLVERTDAEAAMAAGDVFIWPTEPITCDLFFAHQTSRGQDPLIRALKAIVMDVWEVEAEASAGSSSSSIRRIDRAS